MVALRRSALADGQSVTVHSATKRARGQEKDAQLCLRCFVCAHEQLSTKRDNGGRGWGSGSVLCASKKIGPQACITVPSDKIRGRVCVAGREGTVS